MLESLSMVKIRLTRTGKKHQPHYRIVAVDSRVKRDGKYLEKIGYYNPRTKPPTLEYDKEILTKWIENGAQMTDTVHDIFVKEGIVEQTGKRKARISAMITASKEENAPEEEESSEETGQKEEKAETSTEEKTESEDQPTKDTDKKEDDNNDEKDSNNDKSDKEEDQKESE